MVDTLYQWYKKYGDACEEFTVGFVGSPEDHEALMNCLLSLIQQEEPLRPLFIRLGRVEVAFVSRDGTVLKESNLKIESGRIARSGPTPRLGRRGVGSIEVGARRLRRFIVLHL